MIRTLLVFVFCLQASVMFADDDPCKKGFERLAILSNNGTVSSTEFTETKVIVDSLQRNECYEYEVDRNGVVYAGASLSYLYGKICAICNTADAIKAYAGYVEKNAGTDDADMYSAFENLFYNMPLIFTTEILNNGTDTLLFKALAKGFISNAYQKYFTRVDKSNYKGLFYKRYAFLHEASEKRSEIILRVLTVIEQELK